MTLGDKDPHVLVPFLQDQAWCLWRDWCLGHETGQMPLPRRVGLLHPNLSVGRAEGTSLPKLW